MAAVVTYLAWSNPQRWNGPQTWAGFLASAFDGVAGIALSAVSSAETLSVVGGSAPVTAISGGEPTSAPVRQLMSEVAQQEPAT